MDKKFYRTIRRGYRAIDCGNTTTVKKIVKKNKFYGPIFLFYAAEYGYVEVMKQLVKITGFDIRKTTGETLLHVAAENLQEDAVEFLLEKIAVDVTDNDGCTPLYLVADKDLNSSCSYHVYDKKCRMCKTKRENLVKAKKICKLLLQHGANSKTINSFGHMPLTQACPQIRKLLRKYCEKEK